MLHFTCAEFADFVFANVKKGRQHAALIYESIFRTGSPKKDLAFQNAQELFDAIAGLAKVSLPTLTQQIEDDSTRKILLRYTDGLEVESVLIPMQTGGTLCISSQVGCRMGCAFCETGKMGLLRHLTTEEIVAQVFVARHICHLEFSNVVFMGMGEPFDNYDAVLQASKVLMDSHGFGFGKRKITISTSGSIEGIRRFADEGKETPNLAVSVNASSDLQRNRLMPINRKANMSALYKAMKYYNQQTGRQILVAYVLIQGVNDTPEDADRLTAYLEGLDVKVNLIPYNPQIRDRFQAPTPGQIEMFLTHLRSKGMGTLLRRTKGRPIRAGCGQLATKRKPAYN